MHAHAVLIAVLFASAEVDPHSLFERAEAARKSGRLEEALGLLREAHQQDPRPELLHNIGVLLEELGNYRDAIGVYRTVLESKAIAPDLRSNEEGRVARLQPKLSRAHLLIEGAPNAWVELASGVRVEAKNGERALDPGRGLAAIFGAVDGVIVFRVIELVEGRRTTLSDLAKRTGDEGLIELDPSGPVELSIDGRRYTLPTDIARARLPEGFYEILVRWKVGDPELWRGSIYAAQSVRITQRNTAERIINTEAPAQPVARRSLLVPAISIAVGAIALGTGTGLWISANHDVSVVEDVTTNGIVHGLDYDQVRALDDRAATKGHFAVGLAVTGAVALLFAGGMLYFD